MEDVNFNVGGLKFNNFNPDDIQSEETINCVFVVDISPSIEEFEDELNAAFNDFVQEMQKSHVADRLMVSIVEFCETVSVKNGFMPILNLPAMKFKASGSGTAIFDAVNEGVKNAVNYRETLQNSGINTKTLVFILTDGMDNSSGLKADAIKQLLENITSDEKNAFSFTTILFGIGKRNEHYFNDIKDRMGIKISATIDNTPKEIRKMITMISSSISTTSTGQNLSQVNF